MIVEKNNKKICYYWIYVLELDNMHYYTGYTNNLTRRYWQHLSGISGAKYTRCFKPVKILQCWRLFDSQGMAIKVESFIRKKGRKFKEALVVSPDKLKSQIFKDYNLDLKIFVFNPLIVENELAKRGRRILVDRTDPFAEIPPKDVYHLPN